jgi:hypothetical protein
VNANVTSKSDISTPQPQCVHLFRAATASEIERFDNDQHRSSSAASLDLAPNCATDAWPNSLA